MNRNLKLALAALLGFSAACTSVKNAPKEDTAKSQDADTTVVKGYSEFPRRVVVMYGVRPPGQAGPATGVHIPDAKVQSAEPEELDPVAEKPTEDTPVMDTKKGAKAPEK